MMYKTIVYFVKWLLVCIAGFSAGCLVASGIFAFITMIGIIPRLTVKTKTGDSSLWYERGVIWGGTLGNVVYLFDLGINLDPIGGTFCAVAFGMGAGIFVGCLAVALAEVIKSFPIFTTRINLRWGMPIVALMLAIGKMLGSMYGLFKLR